LFSKERWLDAGRGRQQLATSIPAGPTRAWIANETGLKGVSLPAGRRANRIAQHGGPVAPRRRRPRIDWRRGGGSRFDAARRRGASL